MKAREVRVFTPNQDPLLAYLELEPHKFRSKPPGLSDAEAKLPIPPKFFFEFRENTWGGGFAVDMAAWEVMTPVIFLANFFHSATSKGELKEKGTPLLTRLQFDR